MVIKKKQMDLKKKSMQFSMNFLKLSRIMSTVNKSWINITAEVHVEFAKEYRGKGPVLYPVSIEPAEKPEDELVYFS